MRGFADFYQRFSVRQPLKTPPELVTLQLGEPNSETPTPASPPTKSVIYAALGLPPGGTPSIFLIPPKALVVVDAGLGTIIYVGDPVSGNGTAAMTDGDKGEEVCNALRQRVATAYGWR